MRSRPLLIFSAVAVLLILAIARVELVYRWQLAPVLASHQATQARHLPLYQRDMRLLWEKLPFRRNKLGQADAGPYLNPLLSWLPQGAPGRKSR